MLSMGSGFDPQQHGLLTCITPAVLFSLHHFKLHHLLPLSSQLLWYLCLKTDQNRELPCVALSPAVFESWDAAIVPQACRCLMLSPLHMPGDSERSLMLSPLQRTLRFDVAEPLDLRFFLMQSKECVSF